LLLKSHISAELTWANITNTSLVSLSKSLCTDLYHVEGKTTFKDEFVTAGGIRLDEIDPATMESRKVSALYFAGEVMDVDGITGGYNFQHAWSSGWIAANAISKGTNRG
jgi:predicted flavoprotein YhiN